MCNFLDVFAAVVSHEAYGLMDGLPSETSSICFPVASRLHANRQAS